MNVQLIALAVILLATGAAVTFLWWRKPQMKPPAPGERRAVNSIFQATFEHHPAGIGFMNAEGRWLGANARLVSELGYPRAELFATSLRLLTHPQDRKHESALVGELRSGKRQSYQITKRILRKSGEYGRYRVQMFRCTGEEASVLQCIVEPDDLSTTRLERVAHALQEVPDTAAILFDGAGTISGWNLGAERLFGFSETEIVGRPWATLQADHAAATSRLRLTAADEHGRTASETARIRKDGTEVNVSGTILSDIRLDEPNQYLEICRARESSTEIDEEADEVLEADAAIQEELARAAEREAELLKKIAALTAANSEFARKLGMLKSVVRKTVSARSRPAGPPPATASGIEEGLTESSVSEVSWTAGAGDAIYDTVRTVASESRSGTLLLNVGGVERRFIFRNGFLVACTSEDDEHAIGQLLVEAGTINHKQRRSALEAHKMTGVPMGSSLLEMGMITKQDLESVIRTKALRELADAAAPDRIQYAFVNRDLSPPGMVPIAIDMLAAMGMGGPSEANASLQPEAVEPTRTFVGRSGPRSRVYHDPECGTARRIPKKLRLTFDTAAEAEAQTFRRCERCLPGTGL